MSGPAPEGAGRPEPTREPVRDLAPVFELLTKAEMYMTGSPKDTDQRAAALSLIATAQLTHRGVLALESIASSLRRAETAEIAETRIRVAGHLDLAERERKRTRMEARMLAYRQLHQQLGLKTRPNLAAEMVDVFEQLAAMAGDEQTFTP